MVDGYHAAAITVGAQEMGHNSTHWVLVIGLAASMPARADNPRFQDFFFDVCANPTGALAQRCSETPSGAGNLSGESESSLNPSQTLSTTDGALSEARARSKEARERVERYRGSEEEGAGARLGLGPVSLLLNGRLETEERDREIDVDPERGYEADRRAIEIGLDRRFSDHFVAGLLYAYEDGDLKFDADAAGVSFSPAADAGSIDREAHAVTAFGVLRLSERVYVEANAGYASSDYVMIRNAVFQESGRSVPQTAVHTRAETDGHQYWLGATTGYEWRAGAASYGIYGGATYVESRLDGYRERDGGDSGLALVVDDMVRDAVTTHMGFRAQRAIGTTSAVWLPQLRVEYEHTSAADEPDATIGFALDGDENRFALEGDSADNHFNVGVSLSAIFPNGWISFLDLEGIAGAEDRQQYRVTVGIRKEL